MNQLNYTTSTSNKNKRKKITTPKNKFKHPLKRIEFFNEDIDIDTEVDNSSHLLMIDLSDRTFTIRFRYELDSDLNIGAHVFYFFFEIIITQDSTSYQYCDDELKLKLKFHNSISKKLAVTSNKNEFKIGGNLMNKVQLINPIEHDEFEFYFVKYTIPDQMRNLFKSNYLNVKFIEKPKFLSYFIKLFDFGANVSDYMSDYMTDSTSETDQYVYTHKCSEENSTITTYPIEESLEKESIDTNDTFSVSNYPSFNYYPYEQKFDYDMFIENYPNNLIRRDNNCYKDSFDEFTSNSILDIEAKSPCNHISIKLDLNNLKNCIFICPSVNCKIKFRYSFCKKLMVLISCYYHDKHLKRCCSYLNLDKYKFLR